MIVTKALEGNGVYLLPWWYNLGDKSDWEHLISTADDVYVQTANHQVLIFMFVFFLGVHFRM